MTDLLSIFQPWIQSNGVRSVPVKLLTKKSEDRAALHNILVRSVERKWSSLSLSYQFVVSLFSCVPVPAVQSWPSPPCPTNAPPLVIGNPINRNLSNPPTQTTSISLETASSTTNHAFTQTSLIPRGLFFKIVTLLLFGKLWLTAHIYRIYSATRHICSSGTDKHVIFLQKEPARREKIRRLEKRKCLNGEKILKCHSIYCTK